MGLVSVVARVKMAAQVLLGLLVRKGKEVQTENPGRTEYLVPQEKG